jgi:hypothetical protein
VADDGELIKVGTGSQCRHLVDDGGEGVDDGVEIGDACPPNAGDGVVVECNAVAAGVEVGRLHNDESGLCPSVREGFVGVHRPFVAVRKDDHRQAIPGDRSGHFDLQGQQAVDSVYDEGSYGHDRPGEGSGLEWFGSVRGHVMRLGRPELPFGNLGPWTVMRMAP